MNKYFIHLEKKISFVIKFNSYRVRLHTIYIPTLERFTGDVFFCPLNRVWKHHSQDTTWSRNHDHLLYHWHSNNNAGDEDLGGTLSHWS